MVFDLPLIATENLFRISLIAGVALFARLMLAIFLVGLVKKISHSTSKTRISTLTSVVSAVLSTLIWLITFLIIMKEVGFDITPIIASAGVVGVAVAFGAQTLVKDVLSGFFLLLDDQFREGEVIEAAGKKGEVERATLRAVTIREKHGELTVIPYSAMTVVTNFSRVKGSN